MSREQLSVGDLLPLLETSDLRQLDEIKGLINEHLSTGPAKFKYLLHDSYFNSLQCFNA